MKKKNDYREEMIFAFHSSRLLRSGRVGNSPMIFSLSEINVQLHKDIYVEMDFVVCPISTILLMNISQSEKKHQL